MEGNERISTMDALLFAINLEVMLLQMRILEISAKRKFPASGLKDVREKQLSDKLGRDTKIVKEILLGTLLELAQDGDWRILKEAVAVLERNTNVLELLQMRHEKLKSSLEGICFELHKNRLQWKLDFRKSDLKIAFLRDSVKDCVLNSRMQYDYADRWLSACTEALELQMQVPPAPVPRLDHEDCIHDELLKAYELQIQEKEQMLEYWKTRYFTDTANLEARLSSQCEKLRITVVRRGELESLFKLHEGEMRAWLTFKKERASRLAREERLRKAATRIQAWWRGVMVRRALGAFRYLRNVKKTMPKTKRK